MVTIDQAHRDSSRGTLADIARRLERDAARIREILAATAEPPSPGPDHPTLFGVELADVAQLIRERRIRECALPGCSNLATHTIQDTFSAREVCTTHFTEWSQARPI